MSIAAQGSVFSFASQPAKVGRNGTFDHTTLDWYKVRAPRVSIGTIQDQQVMPLELGGTLTPSGAFKQGYFFAGEVDLIPRLENSIGILLKAAMGVASSVTGVDADAVAVVGLNTHIFRFNPADNSSLPWMAVRRSIKKQSGLFGETGFDCKISNVAITVPNKGKIAARVTMIGRDAEYDNASTWVYENATFEDSTSSADAGRGQFLIGGVDYPILGAQIELANNLSGPDGEMIVGDFRIDDLIALSRSMTVRIIYKWEDEGLYLSTLTGTSSGTEWTSLPFMNDTDSNGYAFDARFESPAEVGATNHPYELRIRANRITWQPDGPLELAGGTIVTQTFIGTILEPATGDYAHVTVSNGQTTY